MPNFCSNLLVIHAPHGQGTAPTEQVKTALRGLNGPLDFTRILPIPAELLDICHGGQRIGGAYHSHWRESLAPNGSVRRIPVPPFHLARYRRELGADNPLDWCRLRWSTKWNAVCEGSEWDENSILFLTAWSPPLGFVQALSQRFPDHRFELCFVEPGVCLNGREVYHQGEARQTELYAMDSDAGRENAERVGLCLPEPDEEPETVEA